MRFQWIASNIQTSLHGRDAIVDNQSDGHFSQSHPDHFPKTNGCICDSCAQPKAEEIEKDDRKHKREHRQHCDTNKVKSIHGATEPIGSSTARKALIGARDEAENGQNGNTDKIESIHGGKTTPNQSRREGRNKM